MDTISLAFLHAEPNGTLSRLLAGISRVNLNWESKLSDLGVN